MQIGSHIPFEVAQQSERGENLCNWYLRAFQADMMEAGLVFAQLVFANPKSAANAEMQTTALEALRSAAMAGVAQAQWMLAQQTPQQQEVP